MGEATKWLTDLPSELITSWKELTDTFYVTFFPPSKMVKLRDNIQNFKRVDGVPIHETWLRFQKFLLSYPTHGLTNDVLLKYLYGSLDSVNKGVEEQQANQARGSHPNYPRPDRNQGGNRDRDDGWRHRDSSPKVPECQHMDKNNLTSRLVIRRGAEEVDNTDLDRLILQNEVLKRHAKKARRGAFGMSPAGSAILTHFSENGTPKWREEEYSVHRRPLW
ncbi:hypothetical protein MTR67_018273 [Solanum verrucosum]|uniref:Retrotransposon gag domain-containing protein n=1 Tax=Solanum verrucosum TaxID=315347 RepID=A0AAF0QM58_SOLVR|nr:hypothetical protein MTR67_018273 [Solanum verrucosum]